MPVTKKFAGRFLCVLFAICVFFTQMLGNVYAAPAIFPQPFDVDAEIVYMINLDTGLVVYEKNSTTQWSPASITKLMTAILAFENIQDLDASTLTMPRYAQDMLYGMNSSTADIRPGESLSAREMLYALLLPSAGEAAITIADYVGGGSVETFVSMMNARAAELGCTATHFSNPHGLYDPENYSTAQDIAIIAQHAMSLPGFAEIVKTLSYTLPENPRYPNGWVILNTNKMLMTAWPDYYRIYIQGIKTGYLDESGYNFVSTAVLGGESYLIVVLGAHGDDTWPHFRVTAQLCDWAFENFSVMPALDTAQAITEVPVRYSKEVDSLLLYPADELLTLLPNESDATTIQQTFNLPEVVSAPVQAGDIIGTVTLRLAGQEIGTVDLLAGQSVERNLILFVIAKIGEFFSSLYFKVFMTLLVIAVVIYIIYIVHLQRRNEKMKKVRRYHR
ncbi:D-alanyl-D-alanine carboxypeptidase [Ruminococcaceae bacterium OttesenSCG-928-N02]|nr:D-alanyl-D-alanine carboxypeptidase [Ruminococcaceae bacterium OttesenSCG-928-N02]